MERSRICVNAANFNSLLWQGVERSVRYNYTGGVPWNFVLRQIKQNNRDWISCDDRRYCNCEKITGICLLA